MSNLRLNFFKHVTNVFSFLLRIAFLFVLLKTRFWWCLFLLASLLFLLRKAIFGNFADLSHQIFWYIVIGARHFVQINSHRTSPTTYFYCTSQKYSVVIGARHFVQSNSHRTSPTYNIFLLHVTEIHILYQLLQLVHLYILFHKVCFLHYLTA